MSEKKIGVLIVAKPANVTYTTGFSGDDSWAVITKSRLYLLTDSRYIEQAKRQSPFCRIIERTGPIVKTAAVQMERLRAVQTAGLERSASIADFDELKKKVRVRVKTVGDIIEDIRSVKDSSEVSSIKAAASIAAKALGQTRRYMKVGITENELAGRLDCEIRKLGARSSFDTIVAFGSNASQAHYQPGARKLRKNDYILIDFGVRYRNYCCDLTRCFAVGRCSAFYRKVYRVVAQAQAAAIETVRAGVEINKVDAAAREVIGRYNLPVYGHGTGHGLGLEVHESPVISAKAKGKLKAGMVVTIEPGVYIAGKLGIRLEDDILVTERGYRILSRGCPHGALPGS